MDKTLNCTDRKRPYSEFVILGVYDGYRGLSSKPNLQQPGEMGSLPRLNVQVLAFMTLVSLLGRSLGCILAPGVSEQCQSSFLIHSYPPTKLNLKLADQTGQI